MTRDNPSPAPGRDPREPIRRRARPWRLVWLAPLVLLPIVLWAVVRAAAVIRWEPPSPPAEAYSPGARALVALHVHTRASGDGRGSFEDVVAAARAAGIDAVVITDHDSFAHAGRAGYHDGVLVLVGSELSTDDGHLLALGLDPPPFPPSFEGDGAIDDVHQHGGFAVAAHPLRRFGSGAPLRWRGGLDRVDGVEVVNLDSAWRESLRPLSLLASLFTMPWAPGPGVTAAAGREERILRQVDDELRRRPLVLLGGADTHGGRSAYVAGFRALANVALLERDLTGRADEDARLVWDALTRGRVMVAYRSLGDPRAASFVAERDGRTYGPGEVAPAGSPLRLRLRSGLDRDTRLRIIHSGQVVAEERGRELEFLAADPGAYRAEIDIAGPFAVPWLLTNAIGLGGNGWPDPGEPQARLPWPKNDGVSLMENLQAENDPFSYARVIGRKGAPRTVIAQLHLGKPESRLQEVWAALVDRTPRELEPFRDLVVVARADKTVRLDLGFTVATPSGSERYRRSIKLEREPRSFRFPLRSFRGRTRGQQPPPDLSVENILLAMDRGNALPGTPVTVSLFAFQLE